MYACVVYTHKVAAGWGGGGGLNFTPSEIFLVSWNSKN